ncbi:MAG: RNA-binding protein [Patescibacteria group bacterium]
MAKRLYVGGLSYDTTEETLRNTFSQAGTVESATIVMDRISGRSRGFGFVEMSTDEEAQAAIEKLNGAEVDGRTLRVNEALPQKRTNDDWSQKGRGFGRPKSFERNRTRDY